jgi:hypothetical protein
MNSSNLVNHLSHESEDTYVTITEVNFNNISRISNKSLLKCISEGNTTFQICDLCYS